MNSFEQNKNNISLTASVGILMLETRFPRIMGDIGNAETWQFPVLYKIVHGSSATAALSANSGELLAPFISAARELVVNGADGITTSCGFLSLFQNELSSAIGVPVATSSLMQVPWVQAMLPPGKRVGVLTIQARNLTAAHLVAAGARLDTPVAGTENGTEFTRVILADESLMDFDACRIDNLEAASELLRQHPDVGAIVLECTNMVPYAADIQFSTGLPVYSIYTLINWFQSGLVPRRF
ncbi:MAG: Asp/Glu/hydantoin racemase [Halioglobus sp.]|jgi:Asp/Glu/hydantoin racemase